LYFCNGDGATKNSNDATTIMSKKCDDMSIPFDTVLALDTQTNSLTELVKQYRTLHA